ncbi:MAG: response regulator [Planctomycetota bacterium]
MHRILVVDDDKKIVAALTLRLENEGYEVASAYDGTSALEFSTREKFSLIVMDINLPFTNGVRAFRELKKLPNQKDTPVIFITASRMPAMRAQAEELGAAGFFEKPYEPTEILARVRELLGDPVKS